MYLSNSRLEGGNAASPGTIVLYHAGQRSLKKRSLKKEERGFDVPGGLKTGCKKKRTGPRIRSAGNQNLVDNAADKVYKISTIGKRLPARSQICFCRRWKTVDEWRACSRRWAVKRGISATIFLGAI